MAEPEVSLAQNPSVANSRISLSLFLERYPSGRYASIVPHSSGKTLSACLRHRKLREALVSAAFKFFRSQLATTRLDVRPRFAWVRSQEPSPRQLDTNRIECCMFSSTAAAILPKYSVSPAGRPTPITTRS